MAHVHQQLIENEKSGQMHSLKISFSIWHQKIAFLETQLIMELRFSSRRLMTAINLIIYRISSKRTFLTRFLVFFSFWHKFDKNGPLIVYLAKWFGILSIKTKIYWIIIVNASNIVS